MPHLRLTPARTASLHIPSLRREAARPPKRQSGTHRARSVFLSELFPCASSAAGFCSKPCGRLSSSALRANIARFFCALRRTGYGATLGGRCPPKTPWQEPEVPCAVLNRRASPCWAHRSFRTAPPGRCFGHWPRSPPVPPTLTQTHAALLARPRCARTLRGSFCACGRTGSMGYVRGLCPL